MVLLLPRLRRTRPQQAKSICCLRRLKNVTASRPRQPSLSFYLIALPGAFPSILSLLPVFSGLFLFLTDDGRRLCCPVPCVGNPSPFSVGLLHLHSHRHHRQCRHPQHPSVAWIDPCLLRSIYLAGKRKKNIHLQISPFLWLSALDRVHRRDPLHNIYSPLLRLLVLLQHLDTS